MSLLVSSFWRAAAYCLHPRVIWLSLVPVLLLMGTSAALAHFYWQDAIGALGAFLESSVVISTVWAWLDAVGLGGAKSMLAPLLLIVVLTPLMVVATLLLVSLLMTPALVNLVALRRFPALARLHGASFLASTGWALGSSLLALGAMVVSIPMWIVPPLVLVLPPLIWGWLTGRVMAFDALAAHASAEERRSLLQTHRKSLLAMGLVAGLLGAAALAGLYLTVHLVAPAGMGAGDVKLAVGLGALTGGLGAPVWLLAALGAPVLTALLGTAVALRRRGRLAATVVPHGPSMCLASLAAAAPAVF